MILSLYRTIEPNIHLRMASILTSTVKKTQVCLNLVEKPVLLGPAVRSHFWEIPSEAGLHCRDSPNPYLAKSLRKSFQIQTAECGLHGAVCMLQNLATSNFATYMKKRRERGKIHPYFKRASIAASCSRRERFSSRILSRSWRNCLYCSSLFSLVRNV